MTDLCRHCAGEGCADAGPERLDPGGDFQKCGADSLEGGGAPAGFPRGGRAQIEHEPIGSGAVRLVEAAQLILVAHLQLCRAVYQLIGNWLQVLKASSGKRDLPALSFDPVDARGSLHLT